jgi:nitrilase
MPTFFEKLTWSPGDGHGLEVVDTRFGKVGALICGENTNPLARYALMAQGEQVHVSTWPAIWPTREAGTGNRNYDNVGANRIRAAAHCFEGKCFGILCAGYLDQDTVDVLSLVSKGPDNAEATLKGSSQAATMFLDPTGAAMLGFVIDRESGEQQQKDSLQHEEGILYVDMDMADCVEGKQYHDVVGGYQRPDIFDLKVDRRWRVPVTFIEGDSV